MKKKRTLFVSIIAVALAVVMVLQMALPGNAAESIVADPSTFNRWHDIVKDDTSKVGRIWTDKTVSIENEFKLFDKSGQGNPVFTINKGGSDFLVSYSALSSTSNTVTTTYSSQPLNIALVLDSSGSMAEKIESTEYIEVYKSDLQTDGNYYIYLDGQYKEVRYDNKSHKWYYKEWIFAPKNYVTPKEDANDTNANRFQFYKSIYSSSIKMDSLKSAVNQFLKNTANQSDKIEQANRKHKVSIVDFDSNVTNVLEGWKDCDKDSIETITSAVNKLAAEGATAADKGFAEAVDLFNNQSITNGDRKDAKNVVIFFTDGEPNHHSGFDYKVAKDAIEKAQTLKKQNVSIYSIGVFEGANPNDTSNNDFNKYMHAVSSNYLNPSLTYKTNPWGKPTYYDIKFNLGERVKDSNYYMAAKNSSDLNDIFTSITNDISVGNQFPTDVNELDGYGNSGFITYTDQLGDYMQLDDVKSLIFADKEFTNPAIEGEGTRQLTYTFNGTAEGGNTGNVLWPEGNVNTIKITVTKGEGRTGDKIVVKIPGAMIPLRHFKVSNKDDELDMTINEALPLRLFYGVSLKDNVNQLLSRPDADMQDYIKNNSKDGKVQFYSNDFDLNRKLPWNENVILGKATSKFTPAKSNSFYYFTEDTLLYTDKECKIPATKFNEEDVANGKTFYYQKPYYKVDKQTNKVVQDVEVIDFKARQLILDRNDVIIKDGKVYIVAGSPRLTRIEDTTFAKVKNTTHTATEATNPQWNTYLKDDPTEIVVCLGNNGLMTRDLPGTLKVSKSVLTNPEGITAPVGAEFKFNIKLTDSNDAELTGEFSAQKFDANNKPLGTEIKVKNNSEITLKANEYYMVYGLQPNSKYVVEEVSIPKGFTAEANLIKGTIESNKENVAAFKNTYTLKSVSTNDTMFNYKKILTGRNWETNDSFYMTLRPTRPMDPIPVADEPGEVVNSSEGNRFEKVITKANVVKDENPNQDIATGNFGKITFTKPGIYVYQVRELFEKSNPGITMDTTKYKVSVDVKDDNEGQLTINSYKVERIIDSNKTEVIDDNITSFENTYSANSVSVSATGFKKYIDNSGQRPLQPGMFKFELISDGINTPMPKDSEDLEDRSGKFVTTKNTVTTGTGQNISFGEIVYESKDIGNEYTYTINEVDESSLNSGIQYDRRSWSVRVKVENKGTQEKPIVSVKPEFKRQGEDAIHDTFVFENSFTPAPIVSGDGEDVPAISGYKQLIGRNMKEDEVFNFILKPINQTVESVKNKHIVLGDGNKELLIAQVSKATKDTKVPFNFEKITFNRPGNYQFVMEEKTPQYDEKGLIYDRHKVNVTVNVTLDKNNQMSAKVIYGEGALNEGKPLFINNYKASFEFDDSNKGLGVSKILKGRNLDSDDFTFKITGNDSQSKNKLNDKGFIEFTNGPKPNGEKLTMYPLKNLQFTEADIGKKYEFTVEEVIPAGAIENVFKGVTYSKDKFKVYMSVNDNGDGTLNVITETTTIDDKPSEILFVNTYKFTPNDFDTTANPQLYKKLSGRDWSNKDTFTFKIEGLQNGETQKLPPKPQYEKVILKNNNYKANQIVPFDFGNIKFTEPGIYSYKVSEEKGNDEKITYHQSPKIITFTVSDNKDGTLKVSSTCNADPYFINTFTDEVQIDSDVVKFNIVKTLQNKELKLDQFKFKIKANDELTAEKIFDGKMESFIKNTEGQLVDGVYKAKFPVFGNRIIKFNQNDLDKTYSFMISEVNDKKPGYTYSDVEYTIDINPYYDSELNKLSLHVYKTDKTGKVELDLNNGIELLFENIYNIKPTEGIEDAQGKPVALKVVKEFKGRPEDKWLTTDKFTFTLTLKDSDANANASANAVTMPKNNQVTIADGTKDHAAIFENITFNKPGQYTFVITEEKAENANGITYAGPQEFTVNVVDNGDGTLTAKFTDEKATGVFTFVNTYKISDNASVSTNDNLVVAKVLSGRDWLDKKDAFTFTLKPSKDYGNAVVLPQNRTVTITNESVDHKATFENITFKKVGVYEFEVTEKIPSKLNGITYDNHTLKYIVTVSDNKQGGLSCSVTEEGNSTFTNTYTTQSTEVPFDPTAGIKVLNGRDMYEGERFTFDVVAQEEGAPMPTSPFVEDAKDGVSKTINFGNITFTKPGIYTYIIKEHIPEEAVQNVYQGIKYDDTVYTLIYTVDHDYLTGTYKYTHKLLAGDKEVSQIKFVNDYKPTSITLDGSTNFSGQKVVENKDEGAPYLLEAGDFKFEMVSKSKNAPLPTKTIVENDANGKFAFGNIKFKLPGEYHYTIKEIDTGISGMSYDGKLVDVIVTVSEDVKTGKLSAKVDLNDKLTFNNTYNPSEVTASISGEKVLIGRDMVDGEFTFKLSPTNETQQAITEGKLVLDNAKTQAINTKVGSISFEDVVTFKKVGTYTFDVTEVKGNDKNITYSNHKSTLTAIVSDDHGALKVHWDVSEPVYFENVYTPFACDIVFTGHKNLTGRDLTDGEFTFVAKDIDGNVVAKGHNDQNGKITLSKIKFDKVGTYNYTIEEVNDGISGVTYDKNIIRAQVVVTDEHGQLKAKVIYDNNVKDITFTNSYSAASTSISLSAIKTMQGRDLINGEFTFLLKDINGNILQQKTNDALGHIIFDTMEYSEEGEYVYTVEELKGDDKNVTYDNNIFKVTVVVKDDLKGHLVPTITIKNINDVDSSIVFKNVYTKPVVPQGQDSTNNTVDTSDHLDLFGFAMMTLVSFAGIMLTTKKSKKLNNKR